MYAWFFIRLGKIILNLGLTMFFPLLVALIDHGVDSPAFCGAIIMTLLVGGGLTLIKPVGDFRRREGVCRGRCRVGVDRIFGSFTFLPVGNRCHLYRCLF